MEGLEKIALEIRKSTFRTVCINKAGHLASSLSSVEILVGLYFGNVLRYNAKVPEWEDRDRFILSKGHAALAFYHVLAKAGYFDRRRVEGFCKEGSEFGGLATYGKIPGVEMTSGSLGHGLSFAAGIAMAARISKNASYQIYTMMGDGELQEGEVWEAALFISHNNLTNLTIIVDNNKIQATGYSKDIINLGNLNEKWRAFGFHVIEVDGHNIDQICEGLRVKADKPKVIIADTVKGKGLSYVENRGDWHYKIPTKQEIEIGLRELGMLEEDLRVNEK
ncbi:MAG: transketolase [Butyrivibrio sp.]|nr:transketolase [Butyrivibrio sp.]